VGRLPKNYQGIDSTIKDVRSLLPDFVNKIARKIEENPQDIIDAWDLIIGKKLSSFTTAYSFDEGILLVKVQSSTLLSLLAHQEKDKLLKLLQKKFSKQTIRDIHFRIG